MELGPAGRRRRAGGTRRREAAEVGEWRGERGRVCGGFISAFVAARWTARASGAARVGTGEEGGGDCEEVRCVVLARVA